jgi:hypothetical protein
MYLEYNDESEIPYTIDLLVTWVHVPTISVRDFQRLSGIVALSLNHMLCNLGRALLSVFSSVSVEMSLWRHVFLGLDGFSCRKSCFSRICVTEHSTVRECQSI